MDSNNTENSSETLLTLLAGLNEIIRNAYITGFKDGQEFMFKLNREESSKPDDEKANKHTGGLESHKTRSLQEAEQILNENS
jgi:hypothetical protein